MSWIIFSHKEQNMIGCMKGYTTMHIKINKSTAYRETAIWHNYQYDIPSFDNKIDTIKLQVKVVELCRGSTDNGVVALRASQLSSDFCTRNVKHSQVAHRRVWLLERVEQLGAWTRFKWDSSSLVFVMWFRFPSFCNWVLYSHWLSRVALG